MDKMTTLDEYKERFFNKIEVTSNCWEWIGSRSQSGLGYGQFWYEKRLIPATHFSWFLATTQWPTDLLLHICQNKACVNPAHLYEGDKIDNALDAIKDGQNHNSNKTHCIKGHTLTDDNLVKVSVFVGRKRRQCLECHNIATKKYREEVKPNVSE